jgi:proteic killer suppression protein
MTKDELPLYRDKRLRQFAAGYRVRDFQSFERQLEKRLAILESAQSKDDLRLLNSNNFEALIGDRKGQFSIRINQQWRLCFEWLDGENRAVNIEVVDYHQEDKL